MTRFFLLAALTFSLTAQAQHDASVVPEDAPDWVSLEAAIADAQAGDKLILVYGYASWCGFCVRFDNEVFTDDAVQAYVNEHFAPTRLNLEDTTRVQFFDVSVTGVELGNAMGIVGTPTSVFVDNDGSMITKVPSFMDPETFLYVLQYVKEEVYETTSFNAYLTARRTGLSLEQATETLVVPPSSDGR